MASDDTRTRILNAAGPIFAQKGYEAATVREICQQAGVNLASVNYYFGGKERLYLEVLGHAHPIKVGWSHPREWPEGTPPEAKLRDFIRSMLTHLLGVEPTSWEEQLIVREIMSPTPAFRELLLEHFQARFGQLQRILHEVLPADTPAYKRHQIGFSIIGQCVYHRAARNIIPLIVGEEELEAHYGIEPLAEHVSQVSLAALGLAPPFARPGSGEPQACESPSTVVDGSVVAAERSGNETR